MQTAKNAAASAKESAANVAATAKAGMDKSKATAQEKVELMTARDPTKKAMATERKEQKLHQAEHNKQETLRYNAAARQAVAAGGTHVTQQSHPGGGGIHATHGGGRHTVHPNNADHTGLGLNPARHATAGGGGTGPNGVDAVYTDGAGLGTTTSNTTAGGVGAPGTGY